MKMLWECYSSTTDKPSAVSMAAINVVLALALWHDPSRKSHDDNRRMRGYLRNSQSILHGLDSREPDLLRLQVVIGLVLLFHAGPNPRTASILVAIAVKMAHRLRLNSKCHSAMLEHSSALERRRVFWIMYIMEREITFRLREPYLQQDHDMDVDLPEFTTINDKGGIVLANDGTTWVNFLLCRIDLARIQAKLYDSMYSVRAANFSVEQRAVEEVVVDSMLRDWKRSIPPQFQPDMVSGNLFPASARYLTMLHFIYYGCLYQAHRVYVHDSEWVRRITDYSDRYALGYAIARIPGGFESPLPSTWLEDVESARECMRLFRVVEHNDLALYG